MYTTVTTDTVNQPRPKPRRRHQLLLWIRRSVIALALLAGIGASYQAIATARDARVFPLTGQQVDVGGYRLHIDCTGPTSPGAPTVILEAGLGATTAAWAWVQPEVAKTTRVCAYDRAGMGGSDPSAETHDAQQITQALHRLLQNANVAGPYVMVGWSYGGLYVRTFADQYGDEVAGMVLLDSSYPDQCTSTPGGQAQCASSRRIYAIAPTLARIGVMRVLGLFQPPSGLPEPQNRQLLAGSATSKAWDAQSAEFLAGPDTTVRVHATRSLANLPLVVVTATEHGTPADLEKLWQGWQKEMAALSGNSRHYVVAGASHTSLVFDAEDAQASVAAILEVVTAVQTGQPLTAK